MLLKMASPANNANTKNVDKHFELDIAKCV